MMIRSIDRFVRALMAVCGIFLVVGAVGNGDFYGYLTTSDGIHIIIGVGILVVCAIAQIIDDNRKS